METTTVPAVLVETPRQPLTRRHVWLAVIIAAVLPVVILGTIIALLISANYNFLEWME